MCQLEWCQKVYSVLNFHALNYSFHTELYDSPFLDSLGSNFASQVSVGGAKYMALVSRALSHHLNERSPTLPECILSRSSESWDPSPPKSKKSKGQMQRTMPQAQVSGQQTNKQGSEAELHLGGTQSSPKGLVRTYVSSSQYMGKETCYKIRNIMKGFLIIMYFKNSENWIVFFLEKYKISEEKTRK